MMTVPLVKLVSVHLLILLLVAAYIPPSSSLRPYGYKETLLQISSWSKANGDSEIAGEKKSMIFRRSLGTKKVPAKKAPPAPKANRMKSNNVA
ncbi:hypothetical protein LINPERPRIM_LOCUS19354 [Linum perenne]